MKVLIIDVEGEGTGVDLGYRAMSADHYVKYWLPTHTGEALPYGKDLIERTPEWETEMDWADLIVLTGNSKYAEKLNVYFGKGYPIFGANIKSAALELDRALGQEVLKEHGIETIPFQVVDSVEEGIKLIEKTGIGYAMKPWGGDADKSMTCVTRDPDHAIFTLMKWEKEGKFKGHLMMQEMMEGIEMGISGMFGPGGWCDALEESFEHKKFMNDDKGENTGEMGTVIHHVKKSKLFEVVLEPLTDYLHMCNYVGDASVNCIIDKSGTPWPLEFTMRIGWPDFCIRQPLIADDPVEWMLALVEGRDEFNVSTKVGVGVLMAHGDFPKAHDPMGTWDSYPITGVKDDKFVSYQQARWGKAPFLMGGKVRQLPSMLTAGNYVLVGTGIGATVKSAATQAYRVVDNIKWPSNIMYRTDIGKRLESELPLLHKHGFANGVNYG